MESPSSLRLGRLQLVVELVRPIALFAAYIATSVVGWWFLAVPLAVATFLASFVALHDAMHDAHRLGRRTNALVLTISGLLLLKSGHGLRTTHLRHHGRPLDEDDPEGKVVHWSLLRVVLAGPFHILGSRAVALRISRTTRAMQIRETVATVVVIGLAIALYRLTGSPAGLVYWAVAAVLSATMALWAAYIPHSLSSCHPLVRAAAFFGRWWTPVLNSFAYHHLHHRYPRVPTALLGDLARIVGPEIAFADETLHREDETRPAESSAAGPASLR